MPSSTTSKTPTASAASIDGESPFARLALLYGPTAPGRLARARVLIVGLGAVGAAAAESLVRSGVGHLTLVDFDILRPSNLNRHPFACHSTLGLPKTDAARTRLLDINPDADITHVSLFIDALTAPPLLADHPADVLIDAIDSLLPKTELLLAAQAATPHPFILSCLGAARKTDPTRLTVADLYDTRVCPLARLLRKRLRRRNAPPGILCVTSTEPPAPPLATRDIPPPPDFLDRGRPRHPMGSLHAVTAAAGLLAARTAIHHILGLP